MTTTDTRTPRTPGPIDDWFGADDAEHTILHRSLMQSMEPDWQARMVACLEELQLAFVHLPQAEAYDLIPGTRHMVGDLTEEQLRAAGVEIEDADGQGAPRYWLDDEEIDEDDLVLLPGTDPVPHHDGGRTYLPPFGDQPAVPAPAHA